MAAPTTPQQQLEALQQFHHQQLMAIQQQHAVQLAQAQQMGQPSAQLLQLQQASAEGIHTSSLPARSQGTASTSNSSPKDWALEYGYG